MTNKSNAKKNEMHINYQSINESRNMALAISVHVK